MAMMRVLTVYCDEDDPQTLEFRFNDAFKLLYKIKERPRKSLFRLNVFREIIKRVSDFSYGESQEEILWKI